MMRRREKRKNERERDEMVGTKQMGIYYLL